MPDYTTASRTKDYFQAQLLRDHPEIVSIAPQMKLDAQGCPTSEAVIVIGINGRNPPRTGGGATVSSKAAIPARLPVVDTRGNLLATDHVEVVIEDEGEIVPHLNTARMRPCPGGFSVGHARVTAGTLGGNAVVDTNAHRTGMVSLVVHAWDGTQGTAGKQASTIIGTNNTTAISSTSATATLTITPAKLTPAPAWTGTGALLTPVLPGSTPAGDTVASVFGSYFADPGVTVAIAVSSVTGTTNGTWQYSSNGGPWTSLNSVKPSQVILLSANDLIRFLPKQPGILGTATLTAYAWNGSGSGTPNLTLHGKTGGTTAFSATTLTATVLVNTAPELNP